MAKTIDAHAELVANHTNEDIVAWLTTQHKMMLKGISSETDAATILGVLSVRLAEVRDVLELLNARMNKEEDAPVVVA